MKQTLGLLILLLLTLVSISAQPSASAARRPDTSAEFDDLRAKGFDALYNLDYETARQVFTEMARRFPEHPAGPQFLAATLWTKTLNDSRRLQTSLYNNDNFYAKTDDKVDPKIAIEFRDLISKARAIEEGRLKKDPKDTEALYFLGATLGLKAAFEGAVQRSFIAALRDGNGSVDKHREVLKLDPAFHDAELTIGLYDYVVGSLALPFKVIASIAGARGSRRRGIETLQRVAKEGDWTKDDAKTMLLALLKREKRYNDSLAVSKELSVKYPRNFLFKLESADALVSQAALDRAGSPALALSEQRDAIQILDSLLRDKGSHSAAASSMDLIHFRYGEALSSVGENERAAREFLAAAATPTAPAGLLTMSLLRAAQTQDLAGKRELALANYKEVLARPDIYEAHEAARNGLKQPYRIQADSGVASVQPGNSGSD